MGFGFRIVPVGLHPGLVNSDDDIHEVEVTVCGVQHVLRDFNTKFLLRFYDSLLNIGMFTSNFIVCIYDFYNMIGRDHVKIKCRSPSLDSC